VFGSPPTASQCAGLGQRSLGSGFFISAFAECQLLAISGHQRAPSITTAFRLIADINRPKADMLGLMSAFPTFTTVLPSTADVDHDRRLRPLLTLSSHHNDSGGVAAPGAMVAVGRCRVEIDGVGLAELVVFAADIDDELSFQHVDEFRAFMGMGFRAIRTSWEVRVVALQLAVVDGEVEALEEIGGCRVLEHLAQDRFVLVPSC